MMDRGPVSAMMVLSIGSNHQEQIKLKEGRKLPEERFDPLFYQYYLNHVKQWVI